MSNISSDKAYTYVFGHESFVETFYDDGKGITTIGVGLSMKSLTKEEQNKVIKLMGGRLK